MLKMHVDHAAVTSVTSAAVSTRASSAATIPEQRTPRVTCSAAISPPLSSGKLGQSSRAPRHAMCCLMLPLTSTSLAGARDGHTASTRHRHAVRERDHHRRRLLTSLKVCHTAKPSPSRLSQSIHHADCAVCSFDHRKTRVTRALSLLVGLSSLEQLPATSGARITLLPPHLA